MQSDTTNKPRARIAWLSPDAKSLSAARPQFKKAGYRLIDAGARASGDLAPADLAIVDFRARRINGQAVRRLAALTRRAAPDCGIVYLGAPMLSPAERAHLRRSGELVLVEDDLRPAIETCRQRLRLRNVAEEAGERLKSIAASTRLSEFPPIEASRAAPSALIAGAPGAAALIALAVGEAIGPGSAGVLSAGQAIRALETGAFDCAVFLAKTEGDPLIGLARSMRRHRKFCTVPIILVGDDEAARTRIAANWGSETLARDHLVDDLSARITSLTRRARLMASMRRFMSACAGDGVRDKLSGAFTRQFFHQHAARVLARAKQTGRPICLVGLRLASLGPDGAQNGAETGARMLTEAARLINRVTRVEDCLGRLSADTFVALLSATTAEDAGAAARRIEGVIANTMFRSRTHSALFAMAAATAAVESPPGVCVEEAIAGVLAKLNAATPRTAER